MICSRFDGGIEAQRLCFERFAPFSYVVLELFQLCMLPSVDLAWREMSGLGWLSINQSISHQLFLPCLLFQREPHLSAYTSFPHLFLVCWQLECSYVSAVRM